MTTEGVHRALGTSFRFEAPRSLAAMLRPAYADLLDPSSRAAEHEISVSRRLWRGWDVRLDGVPTDDVEDESSALRATRRAVNELATRSVAGTHTVLNAAAVEISGSAVAIVGPGSSGKTTVSVAAVLKGHGFVADDVVAVDGEGVVQPYHRPANVRLVEAPRLGLEVPAGPFEHGYPLRMGDRARLSTGAPLRLIVLVSRYNGRTFVQPRTPADALMRLANQSLRVAGLERRMFRRLETLVRQVPAVSLYHHDLDAAVDLLEAEVNERSLA